jgi:hypothetical protein
MAQMYARTHSHLLVTSAAALAGDSLTFRMKPGVSMMVRFGQWRYLQTVVTAHASVTLHIERVATPCAPQCTLPCQQQLLYRTGQDSMQPLVSIYSGAVFTSSQRSSVHSH